jgi:hypothetical protein
MGKPLLSPSMVVPKRSSTGTVQDLAGHHGVEVLGGERRRFGRADLELAGARACLVILEEQPCQ